MITYLINQAALAGFDLINSRIDAYRIFKKKHIAHGVNFGAYAAFALVLYYLTIKPVMTWAGFPYIDLAVFLISAFCNRQFTFDIPLNLRRKLPWDYVTMAEKPGSLTDRVEIFLFGYNGRAPFVMYGIIWLGCLIAKIWI